MFLVSDGLTGGAGAAAAAMESVEAIDRLVPATAHSNEDRVLAAQQNCRPQCPYRLSPPAGPHSENTVQNHSYLVWKRISENYEVGESETDISVPRYADSRPRVRATLLNETVGTPQLSDCTPVGPGQLLFGLRGCGRDGREGVSPRPEPLLITECSSTAPGTAQRGCRSSTCPSLPLRHGSIAAHQK